MFGGGGGAYSVLGRVKGTLSLPDACTLHYTTSMYTFNVLFTLLSWASKDRPIPQHTCTQQWAKKDINVHEHTPQNTCLHHQSHNNKGLYLWSASISGLDLEHLPLL